MKTLRGRELFAGTAAGKTMRLAAPISLWGGVDPATGRVCDPRHPDYGARVSDRVLCIPSLVGSSSSSAVLLELLRAGTAPAALLLGANDAILILGLLVARELGYRTIPVIEIAERDLLSIPQDADVRVSAGGEVSWENPSAR